MRHLNHRALAALALAGMLASGTALAQKVDDPTQFTYEQLQKKLILGKTTKEEVRAMYGEPDHISRASAKEGGYETNWSYYPSKSHGEKARQRVTGFLKGMIPGRAGTATDVAEDHGVGARNVKDYSLYVSFTKTGIVEDFDLTEYNDSQRF